MGQRENSGGQAELFVEHALFGDTLDKPELLWAVAAVAETADRLDDEPPPASGVGASSPRLRRLMLSSTHGLDGENRKRTNVPIPAESSVDRRKLDFFACGSKRWKRDGTSTIRGLGEERGA